MERFPEPLEVAIFGGGIAGLTIAYRLLQDAPWLRIALFEATGRLGGKVLTERIRTENGDFIVEAGPDSYLAQKPWARDLAVELGLADEIISNHSTPHPVMLMKNGNLHALPEGIRLIAPTRAVHFVRSSLLGPIDKLRVGYDLVLPARKGSDDESLASFVKRRLGAAALDWIAEPLVAGIYNADPERLSLAATFPQLLKLESTHRSVIRGLRASQPSRGQPPAPLFESFKSGLATLTDALALQVASIVQTGCAPTLLGQTANQEFLISFDNRTPVIARSVVLALPAKTASSLTTTFAPNHLTQLSSLRTTAAGSITMAFCNDQIPKPLQGYGLVIPAKERPEFNALTVASAKFEGRAPVGWTLIRLFFGGYRSHASMELDDEELGSAARRLLTNLMEITTPPRFTRVFRWPAGSPQYDIGHLDRIKSIRADLPSGLSIIGSSYDGVGLPDIVHSASLLATELAIRHPHESNFPFRKSVTSAR